MLGALGYVLSPRARGSVGISLFMVLSLVTLADLIVHMDSPLWLKPRVEQNISTIYTRRWMGAKAPIRSILWILWLLRPWMLKPWMLKPWTLDAKALDVGILKIENKI